MDDQFPNEWEGYYEVLEGLPPGVGALEDNGRTGGAVLTLPRQFNSINTAMSKGESA